MRFIWGEIPLSQTLDPGSAGWQKLASIPPTWGAAQALFGIAPCLFVAGISIQKIADQIPVAYFLALLLSPSILIPIHEFLHVIGYWKSIRSQRMWTGIWPRHGVWYVLWDAPVRKSEVIRMLLAPFVVCDGILLLGMLLLPSPWSWGAGYLLAMHSALCIGDLMTTWRICFQVPRNGWVHNNGWTTFWSPDLSSTNDSAS